MEGPTSSPQLSTLRYVPFKRAMLFPQAPVNKCLVVLQDTLQPRPHELEEAIKSFETPKARIPFRLHNRPTAEEEPGSHTDVEEEEKEGMYAHPCRQGHLMKC